MDFAGAFQWVIAHGYWLMFLAMLIEGPIVTAASAFAAALGFFNLYIVFFLSMAADLGADVLYYGIGYWSNVALVGRFGSFLGLKPERITKLRETLISHSGKVMAAIKLIPGAAPAGLTMVGASHFPVRKFTVISLIISLPKTLFFLLIGFYFGAIYDKVAKYVQYGDYAIIALVIIFIALYIWYRRWSTRLGNRIDPDHLT